MSPEFGVAPAEQFWLRQKANTVLKLAPSGRILKTVPWLPGPLE